MIATRLADEWTTKIWTYKFCWCCCCGCLWICWKSHSFISGSDMQTLIYLFFFFSRAHPLTNSNQKLMWYNSTRKHHNNLTRNVRNKPFLFALFFFPLCRLGESFEILLVKSFELRLSYRIKIESSACLPKCHSGDDDDDNLNGMSASASKHKLAFMQSFFFYLLLLTRSLSLTLVSLWIVYRLQNQFIARDKQFKIGIKNLKRKLFTLDLIVCWSINPGDLLSAFNDAVYFWHALSPPNYPRQNN